MQTNFYCVAGHRFGVTAGEQNFRLMDNYQPFACGAVTAEVQVFTLTIGSGEAPVYTEEMHQEDEGQEIICGRDGQQCVFEFRWWDETAGWLVCRSDYREARLVTTGRHTKMAIDNALMVMYALSTANKGTVLFHAAAVSHEERGYMFLGKSGTGKSTHAGLWVKYIEGTELVNDDNPVVRVDNGRATVYGSPWSGKTPCYRNVHCPLGGIVLLSQAPYNQIKRLQGIAAYVALVPSISGMRWDRRIADGLHQTENALVSQVPTWHLDCLPDEAAARLCREEVRVRSDK